MQTLPGWFYAILLFVSSRGRISRGRYWAGLAGLAVWGLLVAYLARGVLDQPLLAVTAAALVGLPAYCILAKRLHDLGRSARAAPLPGVVLASALVYAQASAVHETWMTWLLGAGALMCAFMLIGLGVARGQKADNRYGHAPGTETERMAGVFD